MPDPTFGTGGTVTTNLPPGGAIFGVTEVLQPDGKILVAGISTPGAPALNTAFLTVIRYNPDGNLDQSFGTHGVLKSGALTDTQLRGASLGLLPDGKILALVDEAVLRFLRNGT